MSSRDLVRRGLTGGNLDIDTSAERLISDVDWATILAAAGVDWAGAQNGLWLMTPSTNSGIVYVGFSDAVTAAGAATTTGAAMGAGMVLPLGLMSPTAIWVIGSAVNQVCTFLLH